MIKDSIKFALRITTHPFDGFWDLKHEKKGKMSVALTILILVIVANIFDVLAGGFLYNIRYRLPVNVMYQVRRVILPYILFCIAN